MLDTRSQYELPMDVIKRPDGLVIVCDLPQTTSDNIKNKTIRPKIIHNQMTNNLELFVEGTRNLYYYKVTLHYCGLYIDNFIDLDGRN